VQHTGGESIQLSTAFSPTALPPESEALRANVRAFLAAHLPAAPPHVRARSWSGFDATFSREMGRNGYIGLTLPATYGGGGADAFARFVLIEELLSVGAPVAAHWFADRQSAPLILRYGTEEQRLRYLPAICRGEMFFCIGMSEPNAGSDLASVQSRATREDGGWVLNGSKIWTTYAHKSHYMIALVRTRGAATDRQKGLSQFIIDLKLPGISITPIVDLNGDAHFCQVFFDQVALGEDALVGEEGDGWEQVNAELAFERSGPERIYSANVLLDCWVEQLRGRASAIDEARLGGLIARMATLRMMSVAVTGQLVRGEKPSVEAALIKDLGTTLEQDIPLIVAESLTSDPGSRVDPEIIRTLAYVAQISPAYSLRGGTREILRGMIARGLGLR
jgi:alkylation response protein AidB-like acyl-CoA dehydrogenase